MSSTFFGPGNLPRSKADVHNVWDDGESPKRLIVSLYFKGDLISSMQRPAVFLSVSYHPDLMTEAVCAFRLGSKLLVLREEWSSYHPIRLDPVQSCIYMF